MMKNVSRTVGDAATVSSLAKDTKANSLRTAKAVALYGKAARHPVCQAALQLWQIDAELDKLTKDIVFLEDTLTQKEEAQALLDQCRNGHKEKEAKEASVLLRKIDKLLPRAKTCYRATAGLWLKLYQWRKIAVVRFERERENAKGDARAKRALLQVRKQWEAIANAASLKGGQHRELGTLKMLHDKVIKATWMKDGAAAGYWEAATGGDRLLSDEVWQGRLTAQELRLHLEASDGASVAGDQDAKEIRRVLRRLGLRPAEGQRGRKWKPPCPAKQKPTKPPGRPRTKVELVFTGNLEVAEADQLILSRGKACERLVTICLRRFLKFGLWDKQLAKIKHPIKHQPPNPVNWRLPLGVEAWQPKPERSPVFAAWMQSIAKLDYPRWMDSITKLAYPVWMNGSLTEILSYRWWLPNG